MEKIKGIMIFLSTLLIAMIGVISYAIIYSNNNQPVFGEGGYILVYDENAKNGKAEAVYFAEGTKYSRRYPDSIVFTDAEGNRRTASADSFVHYNSGAISTISDSVLVDLEEVNSNAVNYYGLGSDTEISRSGNRYSINSQNGQIPLNEVLWKIGENRYLVASQEIYVNLSGSVSYTFKDYVELYYHEAGMLSIITPEETIKTASSECYIMTSSGIAVNAMNKTILVDDVVKMSMSQMVTDSDQNIDILPAGVSGVEIRVPEFEFHIVNGVDGEAGIDGIKGSKGTNGVNGINGLNGDSGFDGKSGIDGLEGIAGEKGNDGEAGEQGKVGNTGKNGQTGATGADGLSGSDGLQGADGNSGRKGTAGQNGTDGADGADGVDGNNGAGGSDGFDGNDGANGGNGANGINREKAEDGFDGDNGRNGAAGNGGSPGNNAQNGADGDPGNVGNRGENGTDATSVTVTALTDHLKKMPRFTVESIVTSATSAAVTIKVDSNEYLDTDKGVKLILVDYYTGKIASPSKYVPCNGQQIDLIDHVFDGLKPDSKYLLSIYADYKIDTDEYNGLFLSREIYTDPLGITVDVSSAGPNYLNVGIQNNTNNTYEISYEVTTNDALPHVVTSNTLTLYGKEQGGKVVAHISEDEYLATSSLESNTIYNFTITDINNGEIADLSKYTNLKFQTAKKYPSVSGAYVFVNKRNNTFELAINNIADQDKSIKRFIFEFYNSLDLDNAIKTIYSTSSKISVVVDGDTFDKNEVYVCKMYAETFDNYTERVYEAGITSTFSMEGFENYPYIVVRGGASPEALYPNKFYSTIEINVPDNVTLDTTQPVFIRYKNYYNIEENINISPDVLRASATAAPGGGMIYPLSFSINELQTDAVYNISVFGTLDFGDGVKQNQLIDTVVIHTPDFLEVSAVPRAVIQTRNTFSFRLAVATPLGLSAEDEAIEATHNNTRLYATQETAYATIKIYDGNVDGTIVTSPSQLTLVETIRVPVNYDALSSTSWTDIITEDDLITSNATSFESGWYTVVVESLEDGTIHANPIPFTTVVYSQELLQTYPKLRDVDINVVALTKSNIKGYMSDTDYDELNAIIDFDKYDIRTVFGYALSADGLDYSLGLWQSIEFYAYDAIEFDANKKANLNNIASFYPEPDNSYMVKVTLPTLDSKIPTALILFNDMVSGSLSDCATKLVERNIKQVTNNPSDVSASVNQQMGRGREYVFTFRLYTKESSYYPEVISENAVMTNSTQYEAPFEEANFYFYPYTSDANSITFMYYVDALDAGAIVSPIETSKGTIAASSNATPDLDCVDAQELKINGLSRGQSVSLSVTTSRYIYADCYMPVALPSFYFFGKSTWSSASTPNTYYEMDANTTLNQFEFTIRFDTEQMANELAYVVAYIKESGATGTGTQFPCTISSVTGQTAVAVLKWSDISSFIGSSLEIRLKLYYDTGVTGFKYLFEHDTNTSIEGYAGKIYAFQEIQSDSTRKYLKLNQTNNGIKTESLAYGSAFTYGGLRIKNPAVSDDPARISLTSKIKSSFSSVSKNLDLSRKGVSSLDMSQYYFAPKELASFDLGYSSTKTEKIEYTVSNMRPSVLLNDGSRITIDPASDTATVNWIIKGRNTATIFEDKVYMDLFEVVSSAGNSTVQNLIWEGCSPVANPRFFVSLTAQDSYSTVITGLSPNRTYSIQLYYFEDATSFNNGVKSYFINDYRPEADPQTVYYKFTTSEAVTISNMRTTFVAKSYDQKNLQLSYSIDGNPTGFRIYYALYKEDAAGNKELVYTHRELVARRMVSLPLSNASEMVANFDFAPGSFMVDGSVVTASDISKYYIRIIPISNGASEYSGSTPEAYESWINSSYLGLSLNYYQNLAIPALRDPFVNIRGINGQNKVTFRISVNDNDRVIVDGKYKVKVYSQGMDITPAEIKNREYSISTANRVTIESLAANQEVTIYVYATKDQQNSGSVLGIASVDYSRLDSVPSYNIANAQATAIGDRGYSIGDVQIISTSANRMRIDFVDSIGMQYVKTFLCSIVDPTGRTQTFTVENLTSVWYEEYNDGYGSSRCFYLPGTNYKFDTKGEYTFNMRFMIEKDSNTYIENVTETYYFTQD